MRIHFMGGADTVTGSQHLVEANGHLVLRDCGLYQGRRQEAFELNRKLPFAADRVHAMELSHAHIDHCGNLPTLIRSGYAGVIHATTATAELTNVMVRDSARIQEQDAAYLNQKKNRQGMPPIEPLYTTAEAEEALKRLKGHRYHDPLELAPGIVMEAFDAGHILGSAVSLYTVREKGRTLKVGFAVDLGRRGLPLIRDPEILPPVDALVIESTYGNRLHGAAVDAEAQLEKIVKATYERGGKVIIPAFALERSQEILYHLSSLILAGRLPRYPVYVDSPMASAVTRIFDHNEHYFDADYEEIKREMGCLMCPPWVHFVSSVEESKEVTASKKSCVVIAASGMCEHGRILHHLKHGIGDPRNSIVIVGYQAEHTLGRRLVEGDTQVRIFGDLFERRAELAVLDAFSAHADRDELLAYLRAVKAPRVFLVHGEAVGREALAGAIRAEKLGDVHLPVRGEAVEL